jgi:hypothetical protein
MPNAPSEAGGRLIPWEDLDAERQLALRIDYARYLDGLSPTCSLEEKNLRFARWLAERGVHFPTA